MSLKRISIQTNDGNRIIQLRNKPFGGGKKNANNPKWWDTNKARVTKSWTDQFSIIEEILADDKNTVSRNGLRAPQCGAIYAALSHWTISNDPAIIVMPTGTGKTETMLSLLIKLKINNLLVIVPSDSLRKQISDKFVSLGMLKDLDIVGKTVQHPIVGFVQHKIKSAEGVDHLWNCCHVVVTTIDSLNSCEEVVRQRIAKLATHVFVDEAHHSTAPTWKAFLGLCKESLIMLFTATPFREDGKRLEGRMIYTYPLALAQKEKYFCHIDVHPIRQFDPNLADQTIASKALDILRHDLANGFNHIIMARVRSISRAEEVFLIYEKYTEFKPVVIHSRLTSSEKKAKLELLKSCESRIAICVDMLGEGFDLPELKIAAIHEGHQSWTIFLQFIGRFVRNRSDLGNASVVINEASEKISKSMKALYRPDSDWNSLIRMQNVAKTEKITKARECYEGFNDVPFSFSIDQIFPKTSVVIYQLPIGKEWDPVNCIEGFRKSVEVDYCVNEENDLLLICAKHTIIPDWTESTSIHDITHDLFAVYYDVEHRLMFLHSSNTDSYHENVAKAIGGKEYSVIQDERVFRCFDGIFELRLFNVGLSEALGTQIRYTMHIGSDVREGLTEVLTTNKSKANLFGTGIRDGKSFSIGGSYKGRIWSRFQFDLAEFRDWCDWVKSKVLDESIDTEKIIKNVWMPELLSSLPTDSLPIYVDWPEDLYKSLSSHKSLFSIGGTSYDWCFAGIQLIRVNANEIHFEITVDSYRSVYSMALKDDEVKYSLIDGVEIQIKPGRTFIVLQQFFKLNPILVRYADLSYSNNNVRYCPPDPLTNPQFDIAKIDVWDWTGTNIKKESQKIEKRPDSIQRRVIIELLKNEEYSIVFDDDDSGEAADVVAIKELNSHFAVELYHLKFSKEVYAGARIDDLYTVCGQAQRSGVWQNPKMNLVQHLRDREVKRNQSTSTSRFERGDMDALFHLQNESHKKPFHFSIIAVQPGLSKAKINSGQLVLLGTTETYLKLAYNVPFSMIPSA